MKATCKHCGVEFEKSAGHLNRANRLGVPVFCTMEHFYASRRDNKSKEQKVAEKSEYDKRYRDKNRDILKKKKHEHFKKTYDPISAADYRKSRMHIHVEYCRKPEYRVKKVEYDREHRAKKIYGAFWESATLLEEIDKHITSVADKHHLRTINGTQNKSKRRKRQWLRLLKNLPQLI